MIINNWQTKRFHEVADIVNVHVDPQKKPYCNFLHVGPKNVESGTGRILNPKTAKDLGLVSTKYKFDEKSIVYSIIRPNLNKLCTPDFSGLCSLNMYPIWPKDFIIKSYLYYFMQSSMFINEAVRFSTDTIVPIINRKDLNCIKVNFPTNLNIQKEIVDTLEQWETAIEKTQNLIAAKKHQFGWLVTKLINKSGHKKKQLSDFISKVFVRNHRNEIDRLLSITKHSEFVLQESLFERRVASANVSNYKIVQQGQYAYNPLHIKSGAISRLDDWNNGILSPTYTVFKLDNKVVNSDYFLHWLSSNEAKQQIKKITQSSVRDAVSFGDLGSILICLPELTVQQTKANALNTAKEEIKLLKKIADQYRMQRRALMEKLLSGQL